MLERKESSLILLCALFLAAEGSFVGTSHPATFRLDRSPFPASRSLQAAKGFGAPGPSGNKGSKKKGKQTRLVDTLNDEEKPARSQPKNKPVVKSEQDALIASLASAASSTAIGRAVAESPMANSPDADPFWELMPSLISSRFPNTRDHELERIAGFMRHTLDPNLPLEDEIIKNPHRPQDEIHAYMPGLGPTQPFHDPSQLKLSQDMSKNFETIRAEYDALVEDSETGFKDRFQSVTSMNYESGWKTLVLFYNGHRIQGFPYHLCPTTTRILESVPLAGRIAGFNRQQPKTGIPLHTDGNNMWLTCQMGVYVPDGEKAYISVGPEIGRWKNGECLLYDTTYKHFTMNEHESQERVVLHVDFFNTLAMTPIEIEVMQYIYSLREQFMKAERRIAVGEQLL
jgi:aspartyl/asparaginyl beta-hydroxylase (cupin superfamily)